MIYLQNSELLMYSKNQMHKTANIKPKHIAIVEDNHKIWTPTSIWLNNSDNYG